MLKDYGSSIWFYDLDPVVQRLDNAIHRINHYPVDSVVCFVNTYPLDSDLCGGQRYPAFEQPGSGDYKFTSGDYFFTTQLPNGYVNSLVVKQLSKKSQRRPGKFKLLPLYQALILCSMQTQTSFWLLFHKCMYCTRGPKARNLSVFTGQHLG